MLFDPVVIEGTARFVTDASVLVTITVQFEYKDLQFKLKDGIQKSEMEILGTLTTMAHRRVATPWDEPVGIPIPPSMLADVAKTGKAIYQKAIPLQPGSYRLNITAKDVVVDSSNATRGKIITPEPRVTNASSSGNFQILN